MLIGKNLWYRAFPELRRFRSEDEAIELLRRFQSEQTRRPYVWILMIATAVGIVALGRLKVLPGYLGAVVQPLILFGVFGPGLVWLGRQALRGFLRKALNARGLPICMKCARPSIARIRATALSCPTSAPKSCGRYFSVNYIRPPPFGS